MFVHVLALSLTVTAVPNPHALIDRALSAMRNRAAPERVQSVRLTGIDHTWILGNAERADGPWRALYAQFAELYDPVTGRLRRTSLILPRDTNNAPEHVTILADSVAGVFDGPRFTTGSRATYEDLIDRVDGLPLRALELASASSGLVYDRVVRRYGVPHDVVSFPWRNGRMRLELSRETHLPDAVEIVRAYPDNFRWAAFGDVTMRTDNVDWTVTPTGAYWPMQQKVSLNGEPLRDVTYSMAVLDVSPVAPDSFAFSDSARAAYHANSALNLSRLRVGMRGQPTVLEPGIVRIPDFWAQTLVKQADGVVIFEAHISAQYLHDVIAEANRRWPGSPIKALVMTSDPWAHIGGVREAMALGIPIYVRATSIPFLTRLAAAPHTLEPDALARSRRSPHFIPVSARTVIGSGANQVVLYPVRGPYAERMLMAYFPVHKLLYGADLVFANRRPNGEPRPGFSETEATDLRRAVAREHLAVDTLICVQNTPPVAWRDFAVN
ncbi:MAG TPA: hypothetical protein VJO52_16455 [Gemmatimonadaceae bacterium]|nr:hypothetical protein [Gemmatimonadaceae bacterium]